MLSKSRPVTASMKERAGEFARTGAGSGQAWCLTQSATPSGRLIGFAKITRDTTERREATIALQKSQEQLAQSQKMEGIGHLTGGVAHDFNNLLTIIMGNLETLRRVARDPKADPSRLNRSIENAMLGAERAAALTQRLLAFSRQQPLEPRVLDVNRLIAGMSDLLRRSLGEDVAIETVLAGGLWRVHVDPNQLEVALLNLAINARDAMQDGGKLTIETANASLDEHYAASQAEVVAGQYVAICVTDSGQWDDAGRHRTGLRAVFHDQGCRSRNRAGAFPGLWLRQTVRRPR